MNYSLFLTWVLYFFALSFLGWVIEVLYRSYQARRLVNPGFLFGPFVPIYGIGGLLILLISVTVTEWSWSLALLVMVLLVTALEYITSILVEYIFRVRLWDYSDEPLNFNGRISLKYSFYWAILIYFYLTFLAKDLLQFLIMMPIQWKIFLTSILFIYFIIDFILSARIYLYFFNLYNLLIKELFKTPSELSQNLLINLKKYAYFFKHYPYLRFRLKKFLRSTQKIHKNLPEPLKMIKNLINDKS